MGLTLLLPNAITGPKIGFGSQKTRFFEGKSIETNYLLVF
jgi:hypothetical protein